MSYDRYDAMADAAHESYSALVETVLDEIIQPILDRIEATDEDQPRPWTRDRELLQVWLDSPEADGAVREILVEEHYEEAEEILRDSYDQGPCCYQFSCPCGNTNNYPG
jgi:hypothetical protein